MAFIFVFASSIMTAAHVRPVERRRSAGRLELFQFLLVRRCAVAISAALRVLAVASSREAGRA